MTREEGIERLANALRYYREMKPRHPGLWHKHLISTARRFNIDLKVMQTALEMAARIKGDDQ